MKRLIVGALMTIILLFSYVAYAERSSLDIATCYIKWLNVYNVSVNSEPYFTPEVDENNNKTLFVDDLAVSYNNSTFVSDWIALFYIDNKTMAIDIIDKWKRAAAFFGALEYGDPDKINYNDMDKAKKEIDTIVTDMNNTMFRYRGLFSRDNVMSFYRGENATFYIAYLSEEQQWLVEAQ